MIARHITVRRTYNTGGYTSQSFEMQAELAWNESPEECLIMLAQQLHHHALVALAEMGIKEISEPCGKVHPPRKRSEPANEDEDEIPF
jgi:hypothetical protein